MLLPIYIYGHPVLRKVSEDITPEYAGLSKLLDDMWQTMYESDGVGLAAPQIGKKHSYFRDRRLPVRGTGSGLQGF